MPEFAVFLELFFVANSPDDCWDESPSEMEIMAKRQSFEHTSHNIGNIMKYVMSFPPEEMADNFCGLYDIVDESERWIYNNDGGKLTLTFHIKMEEEETIEHIECMILNDSLEDRTRLRVRSGEDGPYEGEENGWVISTLDKKYEYGLIDFRRKENIAIIPVNN